MKVAVVKLSTVAKYKRWDAAFYLGDEKLADALKRAEADYAAVCKRLEEKKRAVAEERKRLAAMAEAGEVVPVQ